MKTTTPAEQMDLVAYMALGVLLSLHKHDRIPESIRDIVGQIVAEHDELAPQIGAQLREATQAELRG